MISGFRAKRADLVGGDRKNRRAVIGGFRAKIGGFSRGRAKNGEPKSTDLAAQPNKGPSSRRSGRERTESGRGGFQKTGFGSPVRRPIVLYYRIRTKRNFWRRGRPEAFLEAFFGRVSKKQVLAALFGALLFYTIG